mmetsp:Transcript_32649/g.71831  ORF Transcript_32649/g.71831 Transcript_32649/m.71831 type:complete len:244 (-) Transcript_32649:496-1227(-)
MSPLSSMKLSALLLSAGTNSSKVKVMSISDRSNVQDSSVGGVTSSAMLPRMGSPGSKPNRIELASRSFTAPWAITSWSRAATSPSPCTAIFTAVASAADRLTMSWVTFTRLTALSPWLRRAYRPLVDELSTSWERSREDASVGSSRYRVSWSVFRSRKKDSTSGAVVSLVKRRMRTAFEVSTCTALRLGVRSPSLRERVKSYSQVRKRLGVSAEPINPPSFKVFRSSAERVMWFLESVEAVVR